MRYHRVDPRFWTDLAVLGWSDDAKLLALYLQTCPHRTTEGLFRLPKAYIQADLEWSAERLAEPFAELLAERHGEPGFMAYDEQAQVVLLRDALKDQPPQNDNQVTAALRSLDELSATSLTCEFKRLAERFCVRLAKRLPQGFGEGLGEPIPDPPAPTPALSLAPYRGGGGVTAELSPAALRPQTSVADGVPPPRPLAADASSNGNGSRNGKRKASTRTTNRNGDASGNGVTSQAVQAVFATWQTSTKKKRARLDAKRERAIRAALKAYPLDEVLDAVRGWQHSAHHRGETNGTAYNELTLL